MDASRVRFLTSVYRDGLLNDTIPFWTKHGVDREYGGFLTFLDRDGTVYGTASRRRSSASPMVGQPGYCVNRAPLGHPAAYRSLTAMWYSTTS